MAHKPPGGLFFSLARHFLWLPLFLSSRVVLLLYHLSMGISNPPGGLFFDHFFNFILQNRQFLIIFPKMPAAHSPAGPASKEAAADA